jgi:hydroxymethylpyrimidine kinase/phosphomethylpyrimidine kinase/thiamine-phosphate diphosphorylase
MSEKPVVGLIGGVDSSGAAGIGLDIKVVTNLGAHAAPIVTAVTAQTLTRVDRVEIIDSGVIGAQLQSLMELSSLGAIKVGMLGSSIVVKTIAQCLRGTKLPLIVDPVLSATSGRALLDEEGIKSLRSDLLPMITLLTPNIPEAEILTGQKITSANDMRRAAHHLLEMGPQAVVIKGGHSLGKVAEDFVVDAQGEFWLATPRQSYTVRGTGCAFASAIAGAIVCGHNLRDALVVAKSYLSRGISLSETIQSRGPRVMFHAPWPTRRDDFPVVRYGISDDSSAFSFPMMPQYNIGFYPIVPRASWIEPLADLGVQTIQLRIKDLPLDLLEEEIDQAIALARRYRVHLFINDHWDLALKYEAFGVHLGQQDLVSADLDQLRMKGLRLGISTHSYFEAAVAHGIRPSYVALGPIFPTTCKSMEFGPQGFERIGQWASLLPYPIVAIGGLKPQHLKELQYQGADGYAVISDWLDHANPLKRVQHWLHTLKHLRAEHAL